ncbi:hypothetical protein [Calothrix sp. NIES-2100]|uniref:hypothetical protein n=1 Tax=Calothrix sp. NIES-2100 TaxID=1954172 RepID=UPI0030DD2AFA
MTIRQELESRRGKNFHAFVVGAIASGVVDCKSASSIKYLIERQAIREWVKGRMG